MKTTSLFLLFFTILNTSLWACSCGYVTPINIASAHADLVVIARKAPNNHLANSILIDVSEVIKGDHKYLGKTIRVWADYIFECSSLPRMGSKQAFLLVLHRMNIEDVFDQTTSYDLPDFQQISSQEEYDEWRKKNMAEANKYPNFELPICSIDHVKLTDVVKVRIGDHKDYKSLSKKFPFPYRKKLLTKKELIAILSRE